MLGLTIVEVRVLEKQHIVSSKCHSFYGEVEGAG